MRKSLLGFVLAAALLPVSLVHAGVKEDLDAGKSVEEIIAQAKADGADIEAILGQIIANAPDKAYAAVAAAMVAFPGQVSQIKSFALSRGLDAATIASISANPGLFSGVNGVPGQSQAPTFGAPSVGAAGGPGRPASPT